MKVALIALPTRNTGNQFPNIGAIALAQTVRDIGHEVNLIDMVRYRHSHNDVINAIDKLNPDLIGLSGIITSYYCLEPLSAKLKKSFPNVPLIVGGSLTSALELIEKYTDINFLVKGEGENCITEVISKLSSQTSFNNIDIPGLFVRLGDKFKTPTIEQYYPDLSTVPVPAYDLYDMEYYIDSCTKNAYRFIKLYPKIHEELGNEVRFFPVVITRGCPYSCLFCYRLIKKFRYPPIDNVVKHLRMIKEKYSCSGINLMDELIITDKRWFGELCEAIASQVPGLRIFSGAGRVNLVTSDIIRQAKKAGFIRFGCGIESGSQTILDNLNKKTTVEQNLNAVKLIKESGMMATCNFIFGSPGENKETLKETERLIQRWFDPGDYATNLAVAYPGAPLFDYAVNKGILQRDKIHEYVLSASFGEYPLNFSDFSSAEKLCKEVHSMQFRLMVHFLWKGHKYGSIIKFTLEQLVIESYLILKKISPDLARVVRWIKHKIYRQRMVITE